MKSSAALTSLEEQIATEHTALLVIDMQNGFVSPKGEMAGFGYSLTPKLAIDGTFSSTSCQWDWGGYTGFSGDVSASKSWPFIFMAGPVPVPMYAKASFSLSSSSR